MAKKTIESVFTVSEYKTGRSEEITVTGAGPEVAKFVRKQYLGRFVKIVLEGFEIDGNFVPLETR